MYVLSIVDHYNVFILNKALLYYLFLSIFIQKVQSHINLDFTKKSISLQPLLEEEIISTTYYITRLC